MLKPAISILALAITSATATFHAGNASAEQMMEEIVVTATKRETSLLDVPFSINAQTESDLRRESTMDLEDLSRNVAGLAIQNLGPGQSQVAIRGVSAGQIIRDQPGVKEQVGIYLDESVISLSLFTPDLDFFDLNRVETLRGPQGTLFGSGSVGGTIRYITNQPRLDVSEFAAEASGNTIQDGDQGGHVKGLFNVPIIDETLAVRGVGYFRHYPGYIDAIRENGTVTTNVNKGDRSGIRLAATWQPMDTVTITPRVVYQELNMDGFNRQEVYNLYANPYTTTRRAIQLGERQQFLRLEEDFMDRFLLWDVTAQAAIDDLDLTYILSYTDRDIMVSRDASALTGSVSVDVGMAAAGVLLPSNLVDRTKLGQVTHEIRLGSTMDRLNWVVGIFYSNTDRDYSQRLPTRGYDAFLDATFGDGTSDAARNGFSETDSPFNSDLPYDLTQSALFGELTYDVNDRLHVTVGGRFYDFEEERTIKTGGFFSAQDSGLDRTSSDGFTPRLLVAYDISDSMMFNAQVSKGFRLGGVNDPLNTALCNDNDKAIFGGFQSYGDESLINYEAGIKGSHRGVRFNASAFYSDIQDLQVTLDAGSCSSRISFNVADAHSQGIEFEVGAPINDFIDVSVAGTFLESEFDSTVIDSTGSVLGGVRDGNKLASVPETQLAAVANMTWPEEVMGGQLSFTFSVQHMGDRFTQPSDQVPGAGNFVSGLAFGGATGNEVTAVDLKLGSYEIANLSASFAKDTWVATVFINNLTDENADLSFDRERGGRARLGYRTNTPRMAGVTIRTDF